MWAPNVEFLIYILILIRQILMATRIDIDSVPI